MATNKTSRLDTKGVVNHFGGCSKLHAALSSNGICISLKTVEAWISRGSIPSARLVELADLGRKLKNPFTVDAFIVRL